MLPRKFKIAFEGCREDHALASINDIGWRARIENGSRGFRVTVAGGTSILPVTGYVLYEFLPVEEMFNVAEAVVRVFHRFGDYEHRQRNRLKFTVQRARLGGLPRAVSRNALDEFQSRGRRRCLRSQPTICAPSRRRIGPPPTPHRCRRSPPMASTPVKGPGIMPGTVRLQPLPTVTCAGCAAT